MNCEESEKAMTKTTAEQYKPRFCHECKNYKDVGQAFWGICEYMTTTLKATHTVHVMHAACGAFDEENVKAKKS